MRYINRKTGDIIDQATFLSLSQEGRDKYHVINDSTTKPKENDSMSIGDAIAYTVTLPFAIVGGIFDN